MDLWNFKNKKQEVWNEFMIHYTKLILDNNAKFDHEYTYELEVGKLEKDLCNCMNIIQYIYDKIIVNIVEGVKVQ